MINPLLTLKGKNFEKQENKTRTPYSSSIIVPFYNYSSALDKKTRENRKYHFSMSPVFIAQFFQENIK